MFNHVIALSLRNRLVVLAATAVVVAYGLFLYLSGQLPVDVFPDLNRPTVTVMTEAPGLTPEQVEVLVSRPIESLLNGATGVQRVRSSSAIGLSICWVEFDWGSDIFRDRQIVTEKLQLARERLPKEANPTLAPVTSIMGEIMLIGIRSSRNATTPEQSMQLRTLAEFKLRNRLLAVEGVAQVSVIGGILKQYQVLTSPARLQAHDVTLEQLVGAAEKANVLAGGGIIERSTRESLLSISGRSLTLQDIEETPVAWRDPRPVLIRDVADVRFGGPIRRGDGSVRLRVDVH